MTVKRPQLDNEYCKLMMLMVMAVTTPMMLLLLLRLLLLLLLLMTPMRILVQCDKRSTRAAATAVNIS